MLAVVFIGVIQHEVAQAQLRRLVTSVKSEAGTGCITLCNANGLFANAPRLDAQVEMLFDSGIDMVFLGEQAIARSAGRSILSRAAWPMVRPLNMSEEAPGVGALLFNTVTGPVWMLSVADGSGKIQVEPPHLALEKFFANKNDKFPVIINVNGNDFEYREAIAWRYAGRGCPVAIFGCGTGYPVSLSGFDHSDSFFHPDIGSVVVDRSVAGLTPETWWQRNIDRLPVAPMPGWGALRCDYTIVWLNENGKPQKYLQKTEKL